MTVIHTVCRVTTWIKSWIYLSIVCTNSCSCEGVRVFIGTMESSSVSPSSIGGAGRIGPT